MFENLKLKHHLPGKFRLPETAGPIVYWIRRPASGLLAAQIAVHRSLATKSGLARIREEDGYLLHEGPNGEDYNRLYWALDHDPKANLWRLRFSTTYRGAYKVHPYSRHFLKIEVLIYPEFPLPDVTADLFITPRSADKSEIIFEFPKLTTP
jgi:hypothetical protein